MGGDEKVGTVECARELLLDVIVAGAAAMIVFWCWIIFEVLRARGGED